ncbi:hypothetical protein EYF80_038697 [Liparis tanakae]|uniref:Uncharacterized protein n=1 Tax=Liparis tanakae TaxID=230148 RepID=A0A4Z2GCY3_9TELE|nr:hypothetical protein EYF80_038697 [Liparis tanakae]
MADWPPGVTVGVLLELLRLDRLDANLAERKKDGGLRRETDAFRSKAFRSKAFRCWNCCAVTKLTGLFPAISLVPAGIVVRMMFLPRLLMLLRKERERENVVTTVAGTWRTVAVVVPSVSVEHETPGATVRPLAPATTLAAMVMTLAHVDAVSVLLPVVVVTVMV